MPALVKSYCRSLHRSTWVVVALTAMVLALVNVPGQLGYTLDLSSGFRADRDFQHTSHFAHGWPLQFLERKTEVEAPRAIMGMGGGPDTVPTSCWQFWTEVTALRPAYLAIDLMTAAICLLIVGVTFQRWRARRLRVWQLHLRDCFALISLVALTAGWLAYEKRQYDEEQRVLEAMHNFATRSESDIESDVVGSVRLELRGPFWLRQLLGTWWPPLFDRVHQISVTAPGLDYLDHFSHLESVTVYSETTNEQLRVLECLPNLKTLSLDSANAYSLDPDDANDDGSESIRIPCVPSLRGLGMWRTKFRGNGPPKLANLEVLNLGFTDLDDDALVNLCNCPNVTRLCLQYTDLTDAGLIHLRGLTKLTELDLSSTKITGAGMIHLRGLSQLRRLDLATTQVTDANAAGIAELGRLAQLTEICLTDTHMTEAAIEQLRKALPNCRIIAYDLRIGFDPIIDAP